MARHVMSGPLNRKFQPPPRRPSPRHRRIPASKTRSGRHTPSMIRASARLFECQYVASLHSQRVLVVLPLDRPQERDSIPISLGSGFSSTICIQNAPVRPMFVLRQPHCAGALGYKASSFLFVRPKATHAQSAGVNCLRRVELSVKEPKRFQSKGRRRELGYDPTRRRPVAA